MTPDLRAVSGTLCSLLGVEPPEGSCRTVLRPFEGVRAERVLVYAPDAIGSWLVRERAGRFDPVRYQAPYEVELRSMLPTVTPVCFASMFSGLPPEGHGITRYEKRVLECPTVFDAAIDAGLRVAIVTVRDSSIDVLFRGRDLDHHAEDYDPEVTERAVGVLERDEHHLVVVYHQEYDDAIHRTEPRGPEARAAVRRHIASFEELAGTARVAWGARDGALLFTPDHGTHVDPETGRGTHGSDLPEDVEVTHFYGLTGGLDV